MFWNLLLVTTSLFRQLESNLLVVCAHRISFDLAPLVKFPKSNDDNPVYAGIRTKHFNLCIYGLEPIYLREITTFHRSIWINIGVVGVAVVSPCFCCFSTPFVCFMCYRIMTVPVARKGLTPALQCYTSYTGFSPPLRSILPNFPPAPPSLPPSLWQHSGLVTLRNWGSSP